MGNPDQDKVDLAERFDYLGDNLSWPHERVLDKYDRDTWSGPAADTFVQTMNDFKRQINDLMPLYRQTAANIRQKYDLPAGP